MVAHHERVLADDLEAVARVEALRPVVFAPYADPQSPGSVALEPLERRVEQERAATTALVPLQDVEALEFPVAGRDVRVGEVRGACGRVADWGLVSRVLEEEPRRPVRVLEFGAQDVGRVGLVEEGLQVGGIVEVAKSLREAGAREVGERLGVCGGGAADHGCLSSGRLPS